MAAAARRKRSRRAFAGFSRAALRACGGARAPGKYAVTLSRSSAELFLQSSTRRDLRETVFRAWTRARRERRRDRQPPSLREILQLRAERAKLLGYATFAAFQARRHDGEDAGGRARPARSRSGRRRWRAPREEGAHSGDGAAEGGNFAIARMGLALLRREACAAERYDLDEAELSPYFQLDNMIAAAFDVAQQLFGLPSSSSRDLPLYHPDVRACEVTGRAAASMSPCSSAIISRGRRSAAAPG